MTNFLLLPAQTDFTTDIVLLFLALIILTAIAVKLAFTEQLLENIIWMSGFSVFISLIYLSLDAPDVAMTEVALGACLSTCVLLNIVKYINSTRQYISSSNGHTKKSHLTLAILICAIFIALLSYIGFYFAEFGNNQQLLNSPANSHYINNTYTEIGIPSMVAAVLASYRGFDTLGETTVILIAGLATLLILSRQRDVK